MTVTVNCSVNYSYEVEVPENEKNNLPDFCDNADPVYTHIIKTLTDEHLTFEGTINSIVDNDTDEVLYSL